MCSPIEHEEVEMIENVSRMHHNPPQIDDDDSRTLSPCDMINTNVKDEMLLSESRPQSPYTNPHHMQTHQMVSHIKTTSNTIRLQPILEAAIKAEPKVEVERIHSPSSVTVLKECNTEATAPSNQTRMFITHQNTSRQNLETIVEAIRHLEGDQLFGEMTEPTQEAPLALTNKPVQHHQQQQIKVEMNPFLHFRTTSPNSAGATIVSQIHHPHHSINNRPGVIVVKQNS